MATRNPGTPQTEMRDGLRFRRRRTRAGMRSQSMPAPLQPTPTRLSAGKRKRDLSIMPPATKTTPSQASVRAESPPPTEAEGEPVFVDKNTSAPAGMMLKRTVRVVRRKGEHTAEQKRALALAQSKYDCWRLHRQIDISLPPLERLQRLVQRLLESDHLRAQAGDGVTDGEYARVSGQMVASLRDEETAALFEPKTRANPENVALERQLRRLESVRDSYREELARWGRIDKELARMEAEKPPAVQAVRPPETAEHVALADAMKTSIEGVEQYVVVAHRFSEMVRKLQRKAAEDEVKEERIMAAVVRKVGNELGELKTPRKPEAFPVRRF